MTSYCKKLGVKFCSEQTCSLLGKQQGKKLRRKLGRAGAASIYPQATCNIRPPTASLALMPGIPGARPLQGDSEPGLDSVGRRRARNHQLRSPTEYGPGGGAGSLGVSNLRSLTLGASLLLYPPLRLIVTGSPPLALISPQPSSYVIPSWQDQQPWQLPTWPERLARPCHGLHNNRRTGPCHCATR